MAEIVNEEPLKAARRIMVECALKMTKMRGPMRRACIMVLVDGMRPYLAAKAVRKDRQAVQRAVKTLGPKLELVRQEVERHGVRAP